MTLEGAIEYFMRKRRRFHGSAETAVDSAARPTGSFRATVDLRLSSLERQLEELKGRINGLLFLLAGAVATQVILRLFA